MLWLISACSTSFSQATKAQLEVSETFFTLAAALNSCGYDAGLDASMPFRATVRAEVRSALTQSGEAKQAGNAVCQFWIDHQLPGKENDVTPYLSLALDLGAAPEFAPTISEADLAPDAERVLGVISPLKKFYRAANIEALWRKHQSEYQALVNQLHDPVSQLLTQTDLYLKVPFNNYPGQRFVVYMEPLLSPAQVDSRNFGSNYFMVVSPDRERHVRFPEIRHTYLHFVLDPMALSHGNTLKQLEPILEDVRTAPMAQAFKNDISLMVNECLIRAIEARTTIAKSNEAARSAYVQRSVEEGFVLTRVFYDQLGDFEKDSTGLKNAYGNLLHSVSLERERKRARDVAFRDQATPEIVSAVQPAPNEDRLLNVAEQKLAAGDRDGAQKLANEVVQHNHGGEAPGHAVFILARIATLTGKMEEARVSFEQAVGSVHDSRMLAWSHIYLGRIYDIQEKRDVAVEHYRAALAAGDPSADTQAAAERGLTEPYQPRKTAKP
ncbi:MAG: Tetratricopeptide repeat protein [Candidatus Angelobacter sp.]|nr:Tetratricopeptide repeat protein [Candidatus Angelobacter sp.]